MNIRDYNNKRQMSHYTYSRSYLQELPLERKRDAVNKFISTSIGILLRAAASGSKNYIFEMSHLRYEDYPVYPISDMVQLIQEKFPECTVTYQELGGVGGALLKKGVLIDWS